ncbi:MAG: heat-inducible transcriptional repressor HrcA [Candidatus Neomarinimicrobiota bacterium]
MINHPKITLTEREQLVLKITVENYIELMRPVSSNFIRSRHLPTLSPATIRNTLAQLEQYGLLSHMYTSSGRVPTDAGYRYYVDQLLKIDSIPGNLDDQLNRLLTSVSNNVDELMQAVAGMLSQVSRLFGLVLIGRYQESILSDIELVPLASDRIMMVLAMKSGLVRSIVLNLNVSVLRDVLDVVISVLKERLLGLTLKEIQNTIDDRLRDSDIYGHELIQVLINDPALHFSITQNKIIYQSTLIPLLEHPEFQDVEILQRTIAGLDTQRMIGYLANQIGDQPNNILIGHENSDVYLDHCSLVSTRFDSANLMGQLVILGPTRLPYKHVQLILKQFAEILPDVC